MCQTPDYRALVVVTLVSPDQEKIVETFIVSLEEKGQSVFGVDFRELEQRAAELTAEVLGLSREGVLLLAAVPYCQNCGGQMGDPVSMSVLVPISPDFAWKLEEGWNSIPVALSAILVSDLESRVKARVLTTSLMSFMGYSG